MRGLNPGLTTDITFHDFRFYRSDNHIQEVPDLEHQEMAIQSYCGFHVNTG